MPEPDSASEDESSKNDAKAVQEKPAKSEWSAKNPFMTPISENYILNGEGSKKETRHIVFELKDSGLVYKAGDALGAVSYTHLTLPTIYSV